MAHASQAKFLVLPEISPVSLFLLPGFFALENLSYFVHTNSDTFKRIIARGVCKLILENPTCTESSSCSLCPALNILQTLGVTPYSCRQSLLVRMQ